MSEEMSVDGFKLDTKLENAYESLTGDVEKKIWHLKLQS